ncbi:FecR family protein [Pedobacter deserti]|uniref:FecR family protein n=1 Tax=Pedobacter deserti TaxID=2817382 RepID=UPI00210B860F|nr:FecR family protein [Pedobacter sp. SYSU D00382]
MNKDQFQDLLARYSNGQCTEKEKALLNNWLSFGHFDGKVLTDEQLDLRLDKLGRRLNLAARRRRLWPRFAAAASIILILAAGLFYYANHRSMLTKEVSTYAGDADPGKLGATLTLSNGKRISLSDAGNGKLAEESGVVITKAANGELIYEIKAGAAELDNLNTLSTEKGQTYRLRLPDGSNVWLNAASSITYTAGLVESGKRRVTLEGEAFFDVAKDKAHPFVVQSNGHQVEVLGTRFNINSYSDEPVKATTLMEGSIRVLWGASEKTIVPGQQALIQDGSIKVAKVNAADFADWTKGEFNFDQVNFKVAMRKIARWYDVDVSFDESIPENLYTGGWISRDKKLSEVLNFIESSGIARFHLEGKRLHVTR